MHAHANSTLAGVDHGATMKAIDQINKLIAPFRMELLFFLSGLLVNKGLNKGRTIYNIGKIKYILFPFLLWSLFIFLLKEGKSIIFNHATAVNWYYLVSIPVGSTDLTWFLHNIFIFYMITPALLSSKPIPILLTCLLVSYFFPHEWHIGLPGVNYPFINNLFYFFIFFYIGALSQNNGLINRIITCNTAGILSFISTAIVFTITWQLEKEPTWPIYAPFVLCSFILILRAAKTIGNKPYFKPLNFMGVNSLIFYLVHFPAQVVIGYFLCKIIGEGPILFAILLCLGIGIPITVIALKNRIPFLSLAFSAEIKKSKSQHSA
ncbi:acyltransferase [Stutzerimonas chloritidismutans]|uniref:acyltransferase family protein n=1 Tax=Stutzerimonas chloritidismutans TaxID=203192 RepID=UPI0030E3D060